MDKSRRSFLGLSAAIVGACAAGKALASQSATISVKDLPSHDHSVVYAAPLVGEVRQIFSHYGVQVVQHSHLNTYTVTDPGHSHGLEPFCFSEAVPVLKYKYVKWDGMKWVDIS